MARVLGPTGVAIVQADISSISYTVRDTRDPTVEIVGGSLTVSAVVFNALQVNALWNADATGYNFRHDLSTTALPTGSRQYRVEYKFTPASGGPFPVVFHLRALPLLIS